MIGRKKKREARALDFIRASHRLSLSSEPHDQAPQILLLLLFVRVFVLILDRTTACTW